MQNPSTRQREKKNKLMEKQHPWVMRGWAKPKSQHQIFLSTSAASSLLPSSQPNTQNFTGNPKSIHSRSPWSAKAELPSTGIINPRGLSHSAAWNLQIPSSSLSPGFLILHHPSFPGAPCPDHGHTSQWIPLGWGWSWTCLPLLLEKDTTEPRTPPWDAAVEQHKNSALLFSPWHRHLPWSQDLGTGLMRKRANTKKK